jgi:peptidoglycan/xylan/chitin deacetylase (PgdA/CDA1 family)
LEKLGYRHIGWSTAGREWRTRVTARTVAEELVAGVMEYGDGSVVLMHTWPRVMPEALDEAIRRLRDMGASFVTVDELEAPRPARETG